MEGANAVLAITAQPDYLDDIQNGSSASTAPAKYASVFLRTEIRHRQGPGERLAEVYGGGSRGGGDDSGGGASLMPGLDSTTIQDGGVDGKEGMSSAPVGGDSGSGTSGGVSAAVRCRWRAPGRHTPASPWKSMATRSASRRSMNQYLAGALECECWKSIRKSSSDSTSCRCRCISSAVVKVDLIGDLEYGVNWFFERAVTDAGSAERRRPRTLERLARAYHRHADRRGCAGAGLDLPRP